ncbi:MAG: hypothetical protein WB764_20665 [Xanthobacteraceae bacterium]
MHFLPWMISKPAAFAAAAAAQVLMSSADAAPSIPITLSQVVPAELNPPFAAGPPAAGGAPAASPEQAAAFAWQEFFALNWPAAPQEGKAYQREKASDRCRFGDPTCTGPTVWQTFRGKVEIFPGQGDPPGYDQGGAPNFGYDALPNFQYAISIPACDPAQNASPAPWINLDETDQITLDSMYAGTVSDDASPGNSSPKLIRFMAKANRVEYTYVARNQWFDGAPTAIVKATLKYLQEKQASPPQDSSDLVSLPNGTIEVKAAWRPLNPSERRSGRFHTQRVRFYEKAPGPNPTAICFRDAEWGLVALHIIQKTPSAPYFIYATFEQADNLLSDNGLPVEDVDGRILDPAPPTATTPQICSQDKRPTQPTERPSPQVVVTDDPTTCIALPVNEAVFCTNPGNRLYYRNVNNNAPGPSPEPSGGNICVNKRYNAIPDSISDANARAHAAIAAYNKVNGMSSSPWLYYKLINVQYYPGDKVIESPTPNGSLYTSSPPYTATNPSASNFYQANIVVETNRSLQLFSGGLTLGGGGASTDWSDGGPPRKNTYYGGRQYNAGGCLGCHGGQGQTSHLKIQAGDFSVILARGRVTLPEFPAQPTSAGMSAVPRNRSLN